MKRNLLYYGKHSYSFPCDGHDWTPDNRLNKKARNSPSKVQVYYFHPSERCPIDQSIEAKIKAVMQTYFAKETANGTILFKVLNTEDEANLAVVSKFDMHAQALYIIRLENGKRSLRTLPVLPLTTANVNRENQATLNQKLTTPE